MNKIITHHAPFKSLEEAKQKTAERIRAEGDKPYATVEYQLQLLDQLTQFDFGRFLLRTQGINGFWTHYMLTHPWFGKKTGKNNAGEAFTELESFVLNDAPLMLATQERFLIFLRECQTQVKENAVLCAIPCGILGELLYLDFRGIKDFNLVGFDLDDETLVQAKEFAKQKSLDAHVNLHHQDAWSINCENEFDLISSNGLNFYEPNDEKVCELYRIFFAALKPGGKLVASFLTLPPMLTDNCEWDMSKINPAYLLKQKIIFADIAQSRFQCYRSTEQKRAQLKQAGFKNISFIYDQARMMPTAVAYK